VFVRSRARLQFGDSCIIIRDPRALPFTSDVEFGIATTNER